MTGEDCVRTWIEWLARWEKTMPHVALWLVGAFDLLLLMGSALTWLPYATSAGYRAVGVACVWAGVAAQVAVVSLALRWRRRAVPQAGNVPRRHDGALALLVGVAVFDACCLAAGLFALSFQEYRGSGIVSSAYVLANVGALAAAWRLRPWAQQAPATPSVHGSAT